MVTNWLRSSVLIRSRRVPPTQRLLLLVFGLVLFLAKAPHDIPLDNQLVLELEGWVSLAELVEDDPSSVSHHQAFPLHQQFTSTVGQSALRHHGWLETSAPVLYRR
jgi:hypothetical protein